MHALTVGPGASLDVACAVERIENHPGPDSRLSAPLPGAGPRQAVRGGQVFAASPALRAALHVASLCSLVLLRSTSSRAVTGATLALVTVGKQPPASHSANSLLLSPLDDFLTASSLTKL